MMTVLDQEPVTAERVYFVTRHSIIETVKRGFPGWTIHALHEVGVQGFRWKEVSTRIDDVEKYRKEGY